MTTVALGDLNSATPERAAELFKSCCGATAWVSAMLRRRPFRDVDDALGAADEIWSTLGPDDWMEAFSHHPRIGERARVPAATARSTEWSAGEQSGVASATSEIQHELAAANEAYERRFGRVYIVCATGRTPADILENLSQRMNNSPDDELRVAAEEQRRITHLRLQKLLQAVPSA